MVDTAPERSQRAGRAQGRPLVRRHAALIAVTALLVTAGAYLFAALQQPTYTSHVGVLIEPYTLPNAADPAPDLGTEQAIASSGAVSGNAAHALGVPVRVVTSASTVTGSPNADVLDFAYSASTPTAAARGATAVADAYMAYRARTETPPSRNGNPAQTLATPQVKTRLISSATVPGSPSSPDVVIAAIAGVIVGLVVGLAAAFCADRLGRRLRSLTSWQEATGVPVLAALQRDTALDDEQTSADGDRSATVLRYLRARVAQLVHRGGGVLLVTEVGEQPERVAVARMLTNGFAQAGWTAVMLELAGEPVEMPEPDGSIRRGDLCVRESATPRGGGPMRSASNWRPVRLARFLQRIDRTRAKYDILVVTGPSLTTSVTTLDVAAAADLALVLDNVATARRDDVRHVVAELQGAGCRTAGVLLGLGAARTGDGAAAVESVPRTEPDVPRPSNAPARPRRGPSRPDDGRPRMPAPLVTWTDIEAGAGDKPTRESVNGSGR